MENTFNGLIGVLNLKIKDTTRSTKIFCTSRLTVAYLSKIEKIKMGAGEKNNNNWSQKSTITPSIIDRAIIIYNGKEHISIYIT
jgi:ribosomal protein S19